MDGEMLQFGFNFGLVGIYDLRYHKLHTMRFLLINLAWENLTYVRFWVFKVCG